MPTGKGAPQAAKNSSLAAWLHDEIEAAIMAGDLEPGAPLDDRLLAEKYGASRTPVREALLRLSTEGLVQIVPRSGTYVAKPSTKDLVAMLESLSLFESMAARLAARRMTREQREALVQMDNQALARRAELRGDVRAYQELNEKVHEQIYFGSGNPILIETIRNLRRRLGAYQRTFFESPPRVDRSLDEHSAVVRAVVSADERAAEETMAAHIVVGGDAFAEVVMRI
jgi:DNA-binding GntR family transcriptional regulator